MGRDRTQKGKKRGYMCHYRVAEKDEENTSSLLTNPILFSPPVSKKAISFASMN